MAGFTYSTLTTAIGNYTEVGTSVLSSTITDQFIVTTFGNDYKHGYLYLWDLDKLPNLSLARKRHADIETKGMKENDDNNIDAYTDDGKNLIFLSSISKYCS